MAKNTKIHLTSIDIQHIIQFTKILWASSIRISFWIFIKFFVKLWFKVWIVCDVHWHNFFIECLKLYDKHENGTMMLGELEHILLSLGMLMNDTKA